MNRLLPLVLVPLLLPTPSPAQPGKKVALLVGVREYNHSDLPSLTYTENDATELAAVLKDNGFAITLLTDTTGQDAPRKRPTLANLRRELRVMLKDVTKHDTVLVGLAGHGVQPDAKECYFCPRDAKPRDPKTLLGLNALIAEMNDSGAGVKLLLVDACRNDPNPNRGARSGVDPRTVALPRGVAALFSCDAGQRAYEHKDLKHGVFFHHVIEGLKGKAGANDAGEVTWGKLSEYVTTTVPGAVQKLIGPDVTQVPHEIRNLVGPPPVLVKVKVAPTAPVVAAPPLSRLPSGIPFLLKYESVRHELQMTDEQTRKLAGLGDEASRRFVEAFGKVTGSDQKDRAAVEQMVQGIDAWIDEQLKAALAPEQHRRLKQMGRRDKGVRALTDPEVQRVLALTDEQKRKIDGVLAQLAEDKRGNVRDEDAKANLATLNQAALIRAVGVLTAEQKKTWADLIGPPFEKN